MLRRTAIGVVLALLVALPATAADFQRGMAAARSGDYATAIRELRPLAAKGHAQAQNYLGGIYYNGDGVPQDYAEAVKWYRKAASQGDANAQFNLGIGYAKGQGVQQNNVLAFAWFSLATASGLKGAAENRNFLVHQMTPAQIAEAQKLAREWWAKQRRK